MKAITKDEVKQHRIHNDNLKLMNIPIIDIDLYCLTIDQVNNLLSSHVQSELSKTNAGYWKARCEAAEAVLKQPPSRTPQEQKHFEWIRMKWKELERQPEPPSEPSAKIEARFTDEWIDNQWVKGLFDDCENPAKVAEKMRDEILKALTNK